VICRQDSRVYAEFCNQQGTVYLRMSVPNGHDYSQRHSTTCGENKARTEVPEECGENGRIDAFNDDSRDTFMTRYAVLVRF